MDDIILNIGEFLKSRGFVDGQTLAQGLRPGIRILPRPTAMSEIALGSSRIGGVPDIIDNFIWPTHQEKDLLFLAQINLAEIPLNFDFKPFFEHKGWLLFFIVGQDSYNWGLDEEDATACRVLFFPEEASLTRVSTVAGSNKKENGLLSSCALAFESILDLPHQEHESIHEKLMSWPEPLSDEYCERAASPIWTKSGGIETAPIESISTSSLPYHHLLGHTQSCQEDVGFCCERTFGQQVMSVTEEGEAKLQNASRPREWISLLQIETDPLFPELKFGDQGRLYFCIPKDRLPLADFSSARFQIQCG